MENTANQQEKQEQMKKSIAHTMSIPMAIVVAGILIAGAVFFGLKSDNNTKVANPQVQGIEQETGDLDQMTPITSKDHIRGNPDAPVKIVEYSDFECPFCKRFQGTLQQVMDKYEKSGQVAWVYRHYPLDSIHPIKARKEAVAAECANELGGNVAFWRYTDRFFELTPSNNKTDIDTVLPQIANEIGLDKNSFSTCLNSGKYDEHIQDELNNAIATGGKGTPWSIIVAKNGKKYPLTGAQPYEAVKQLIDIALQAK